MTTAEAFALMAAGALLALTGVLAVFCAVTIVRLRAETERLRSARAEAEAATAGLRAVVAEARLAAADLDGRPRGNVGSLAYETLSTPVVKGLALATGIGQAARAMRTR